MNGWTEVKTAKGGVRLPAYMPVSTAGVEYPTDKVIMPFLRRWADMVMMSYHYARKLEHELKMPCFIDSGGFALLLEGSKGIEVDGGIGMIERSTEEGVEQITPQAVLDLQHRLGQWGATLDFPVPPNLAGTDEADRRLHLTVANARWAKDSHEASKVRLFASVQGYDLDSYERCAKQMVDMGFKDLAIGGLVPRIHERELVIGICARVRKVMDQDGLLHGFGVGEPTLVRELYKVGVASVDSSSFVRAAASGKRWDGGWAVDCPSALERGHMALSNLRYACKVSGAASADVEEKAQEQEAKEEALEF